MDFEKDEPILIQERKLVATILSGKPGATSLWVTVFSLILITLISQLYWQDPWDWSRYLPAVRIRVFEGNEWWRIFTAIFIHADWGHLMSNLYMLGFFSYFTCGYYGFFVYPVLSIFVSAIVNLVAIYTYPDEVRLLGASGMVYVLGGFWLTLFFLVQRQHTLFSRALRVTGISLMVFFPSTFVPRTSYRTHAIGFAFGVLIGLVYFAKAKKKLRSYEIYQQSTIEAEPRFH